MSDLMLAGVAIAVFGLGVIGVGILLVIVTSKTSSKSEDKNEK